MYSSRYTLLYSSFLFNLTATISDHLPQFFIAPHTFNNPPSGKSFIFERDWSKFDKEKFVLDYFDVNWNEKLEIMNKDIDHSFNNFLGEINVLLDKYAPFKKVSKYKLKLKKNLGSQQVFRNQFQ